MAPRAAVLACGRRFFMEKAQLYALYVFIAGLLVTYITAPYVIRFAVKKGIVDKPGPRRVNVKPMPRMGGPSMFFGMIIVLGLASIWYDNLMWIAVAMTVVFLTGAIDDMRGLGPLPKLAGQFIAAGIIFKAGIRISYIDLPVLGIGYYYFPVWLSAIITIFWIVGITNTLNLIDGLDGLAAGITCIAAITFFLVALQKGQEGSAVLAAGLVGVTAGFLRWNFYPAKTFMGDSGALTLGFLISVLAVNGAFKSATALTYLLPVLALGVPIFDTSFAIVRRLSKGQPVMSTPDKGHLHHRLLAAGLLHRNAVIIIYIMTLCLSIIALLIIKAYLLALYLVAAIAGLVILLVVLGKVRHSRKVLGPLAPGRRDAPPEDAAEENGNPTVE